MRALRNVGPSLIALGALAIAGCDDGSDVSGSTSVVSIRAGSAALEVADLPGLTPVVNRTREFQVSPVTSMPHAGTRAGFVPPAHDPLRPIDGSRLDNIACEDAVRLGDGGAVNVPVSGGHGEGCFESSFSQRFFSVTVHPGEVLTVFTRSPEAREGDLWFAAAPSCDAPSASCLVGWTWLHGGVALSNPGRLPVDRIVAVIVTEDVTAKSLDIELRRDRLAPNVTCERALPAGDGLEDQEFAGASVEGSDSQMRRALYYTVDIPPMTRASMHIDTTTPLYVFARRDCGEDLSVSPSGEISNTGDETISALITVGVGWQEVDADATFDIIVERSALLPEASCEAPRELAIGDSATIEVDGGGNGPSVCWCFRPQRVSHVTVTVRAGRTAIVSGVTSEDSGATVIELLEACSDTCGDNVGFGWGSSPGVVHLENTGSEDIVRHLVVSSNAVWREDGTMFFPPVALTITAAE